MKEVLEKVINELKEKLGDSIYEVSEFRDDVCVLVDKNRIIDATTILRNSSTCPFPLCEDVFGIDQFRKKNRFEVKYHFFSIREKVRLHLKVQVDETELSVPTISTVYPAANWYERETFDMYGIRFSGHPDLRRAYMPEEYQYYPLRKDYPLMGVPDSIPLPKR